MKNVLDMNNYKIINVRDGEKDNDVVTVRQVKDFTNYIKDVNIKNFEIYGKEILDIKNRLDSDAFYLEKNRKDKTFKFKKYLDPELKTPFINDFKAFDIYYRLFYSSGNFIEMRRGKDVKIANVVNNIIGDKTIFEEEFVNDFAFIFVIEYVSGLGNCIGSKDGKYIFGYYNGNDELYINNQKITKTRTPAKKK